MNAGRVVVALSGELDIASVRALHLLDRAVRNHPGRLGSVAGWLLRMWHLDVAVSDPAERREPTTHVS